MHQAQSNEPSTVPGSQVGNFLWSEIITYEWNIFVLLDHMGRGPFLHSGNSRRLLLLHVTDFAARVILVQTDCHIQDMATWFKMAAKNSLRLLWRILPTLSKLDDAFCCPLLLASSGRFNGSEERKKKCLSENTCFLLKLKIILACKALRYL